MHKFVTHDEKKIKIDVSPDNDDVLSILIDAVPRLSYDEILEGELEKRLGDATVRSVRLTFGDYIKSLIFSLSMFNTISKPPGF
jgi:hypothetical protein